MMKAEQEEYFFPAPLVFMIGEILRFGGEYGSTTTRK
jgi:hypothetical protein